MSRSKQPNRRQFIQGLAGSAIAAALFPTVLPSKVIAAGPRLPSNKIVMGAIGCGSMGCGDINGLTSKSQVYMVALCDVDSNHAAEAKKIVDNRNKNQDSRIYKDYREMLAVEKLDAICHALPDHWHGIISVACARAGCDIYGQKPLARTIEEGRAICNAVKHYGRIWQTGSWQRSVENFRKASELVINSRIGTVKYVEVGLPDGGGSGNFQQKSIPDNLDYNMWLGPAPWRPYTGFGNGTIHWDWRWIMDYSGGQLTDWAGHHIDIAHWGLGLDYAGPVEIEGVGEYPKDGTYNVPTKYKCRCKYANGVEMVVANASQSPRGMGTCWYGDKGWIHVSRGGLWASDDRILQERIAPSEIQLYQSKDHYQNFLDCIITRQETITPAEIAHRSISVGLLCEIAMLTGRKLNWDPQKERFINDPQADNYLRRTFRSPWHL